MSTEEQPVLVDAAAAGVAVHVAAATVRGWAHRGLLKGKGKGPYGRVLYDLADVYRVAGELYGKRPE
ncbi:MerR-like helix-turn-helix DNA binding protein [Arthrobacter phage Eesa]|nr:MerR-like helix-turn-helix DNA binding protein [Arthrobacter phage Eesa]